MKIVISGLMGRGTLEAKIEPLAKIDAVSEIVFVRKTSATPINKTKYISPPLINTIKPLHFILSPLTLLFTVIKHKPEFIVGYHIIPYGFFVSFVGLITKTPYIISQTGLTIQVQTRNRFINKSLYFIFKKSKQVNCPGKDSVAFWQNRYPKIKSKFKVLHSTIDTDYFKPNNAIIKKYDFIFLGRLHEVKRVHLIIEAFKQLIEKSNKELKMVIVGSGPEEENIKKMIVELELEKQVEFTGFIHDPLLKLQQSKFLIMASKSEGLPTSMMQAMACEVVPITNIVGNIGDIVTEFETGFVHNGEVEDINQKLLLLNQIGEEKLEEIKNKAREIIINEHSHKSIKRKWVAVFNEIKINKHVNCTL